MRRPLNPVPVTLIGAGIAWLAIAGPLAGAAMDTPTPGPPWGETGATAYGAAPDGENEPQTAVPSAEVAEAGAASAPGETEVKLQS
jgi:hypothetical protein